MGSVGLIVRICLRVLVGSGSVSMMRMSGYGSLTWNIPEVWQTYFNPPYGADSETTEET